MMSNHQSRSVPTDPDRDAEVDAAGQTEHAGSRSIEGLAPEATVNHTAKSTKKKNRRKKKKRTEVKKEKRSYASAFAAALGFLLLVENVFLATGGLIKPNSIIAGRAALFLTADYFPAAIDDPVDAMKRWGTEDFQALHTGRGLDSYSEWYAPVRQIPSNFVTVVPSGDSPDTFTVVLQRILKTGVNDRYQITMQFKCANFWEAHLPGRSCSVKNLRLNFSAVTVT